MVPRRCSFCGSVRIGVRERGRISRVACVACGAAYRLEERPPDAPDIVARITVIREPRIEEWVTLRATEVPSAGTD